MIPDYTDHMRVDGAESTAQIILALLKSNPHSRSGILWVNDSLEVVSCRFFKCALQYISISSGINEEFLRRTTGIVVFETIQSNMFISNSEILVRLGRSCEILGITLIDVMIFGTNDWVSLRQQNRL